MKIKNIIYIASFSMMMLAVASCNSDMDEVYVLPVPDVSLSGASEDIELNDDNAESLALSLNWSGDGKLSLSDPDYKAPVNAAAEFIEFSKTEDFSTPYSIATENGVRTKQYTGTEFNAVLKQLVFPIGEKLPLYIRIKTELAANVTPTYSNVLKVNVRTDIVPSVISDKLYFSGLVNWDAIEDYLSLYDESTQSYGGAHYINSEWGYRAYTEPNWDAAYTPTETSTAMSGSLVLGGEGNIPAPEAGLYVMDFSMLKLTYDLTKVNTVTYAGLNDNWDETEMVQSKDDPEVFTAEFVKSADTPWGVKVLINHSWSMFFGGGDGKLVLGKSDAIGGFDGDNDLDYGKSYILTVDLGNQTYTYTAK